MRRIAATVALLTLLTACGHAPSGPLGRPFPAGVETGMTAAAQRLRAAVAKAHPDWTLPAGADDAALARLDAAFAPRVVPDELRDLLRVMNGSDRRWLFDPQVGPLLPVDEIVSETRARAGYAAHDDPAFPAGSVVFASEGHVFGVVVARPEARGRGTAYDASYGNGDEWQVAGASLTALVAASADGWEHGTNPDQEPGGQPGTPERARWDAARQRARAASAARDREYPSGDGYLTGRMVKERYVR